MDLLVAVRALCPLLFDEAEMRPVLPFSSGPDGRKAACTGVLRALAVRTRYCVTDM